MLRFPFSHEATGGHTNQPIECELAAVDDVEDDNDNIQTIEISDEDSLGLPSPEEENVQMNEEVIRNAIKRNNEIASEIVGRSPVTHGQIKSIKVALPHFEMRPRVRVTCTCAVCTDSNDKDDENKSSTVEK